MSLYLSQEQVARMLRQYRTKTLNKGDLKIIRLDRNMVDVFTGEGWHSRSRYRWNNGRWCYMSGVRLTAIDVALLPQNRAAGS